MIDLGIDSHHERQSRISTGDVLRRIGEGCRSAEFLEAHEIRVLTPQIKEEVRLGLEAIIRAVIDNGGEIAASLKDVRKVCTLGGRRSASGKHTRNDH